MYVQKTEHSIKKYGNDILRYIGGQTYGICNQHHHPLIPVPDRIATYSRCKRRNILIVLNSGARFVYVINVSMN